MGINYLTISYPDFVLGTTIDPEQVDQNNLDIVTKVNEMVTGINTNTTDIATGNANLTTHKGSADHDGRYYTEVEIDGKIATLNGVDATNATNLTNHKNSSDHDTRYYTKTLLDGGQLDTRYYTETELLNGVLDTRYYTETELLNGILDSRYFTETEVNAIKSDLAGTGRTTESIKGAYDALGVHKNSGDHDTRYYPRTDADTKFTSKDEITTSRKLSPTGDFTGTVLGGIPLTHAEPTLSSIVDGIIATNQTQSAILKHGQNLIHTDRATLLTPTLTGKTLVNLLGNDGNCENVNKWSNWNNTQTLDTTNFVFGTNGIKMTLSATNGTIFKAGTSFNLDASKYYLFSAYVKNGNATNILLQKDTTGGGVAKNSSAQVSSTTAFVRIAMKLQPSDLNAQNTFSVTVLGTSGQYGYVDGIQINEISSADYALTENQLMDKFPYVDSYAPLTNPAITSYGKNLLPPFSAITNTSFSTGTTTTLTSQYSLSMVVTDASVASALYIDIPVLPNTQYTITNSGGNGFIRTSTLIDTVNGGIGTSVLCKNVVSNSQSTTFITPSDTRYIRVLFTNAPNTDATGQTTGTFTFSNPMLNLGSTALPFEPQDKSYLYLPTRLCDGESLQEINGQWVKTKKVQHTVLDGSLAWSFNINYTGYKSISSPNIAPVANTVFSPLITKYDGKILTMGNSSAGDTVGGGAWASGYVSVCISSIDSGWGDAYTPTADEIKAYFYGWRMYDGTTPSTYPVYNGSGTKMWGRRNDSFDGSYNDSTFTGATSILPTTQVPLNSKWQPYQLHYQLATPITEVIQTEGSLVLIEGDNQVEVGEGVVVREVVVPAFNGVNKYAINNLSGYTPPNPLKYRTYKIVSIYKNGIFDPNWILVSDNTSSAWYGKAYAYIPQENYDPSATYTVTYLAQPYQLTASSLDQSATYSTNDHTVLQDVVSDVEDIETRVSVLEEIKANKAQPQWIAPTLLNGWVNNANGFKDAGYFKDEFGFVHIRGLIKSGTMSASTPLFVLPIGYRPSAILLVDAIVSNGTAIYPVSLEIRTDGTVMIYLAITVNSWLNLDGILSFRAEQ